MSAEVDLVALMGKSARIEAIDVGSREMFEAMNKAIEFHAMRPVVDRLCIFGAVRGSQLPERGSPLRQGLSASLTSSNKNGNRMRG